MRELIKPNSPQEGERVMRPEFYEAGSRELEQLLDDRKPVILDSIESQLAELITLRRPGYDWSEAEIELAVRSRLGEQPETYGEWVYYPWRNMLLHLLSEAEFREVRTNRNMHKITADEQRILQTKRIGVIGLSVGSGVAMALAMERCGGTLRIADYDTLELSNLNRIRTSLVNLGLPKATVVAREISEIDPYLNVEVFHEGVTKGNVNAFFGTEAPLDLLIEECDSLPVKILARWEARKRRVPVVMETSDRGMLDVERFDLNPELGILHGRVSDEEAEKLIRTGEWSPDTVAKIMRPDEISDRMRVSLAEMGKTISRWPQIGSEVTAGAGMAVQVARMILLGHENVNGRKFIDADGLFNE